MTITLVRKAKGQRPAQYLVLDGAGAIVGLLEKYANTRTDSHPWKAFLGHGFAVRFLASFYPADGGRAAAVQAIADAAQAQGNR